MKSGKVNKFTQLVKDLESGEIGWTHIQNALREYYGRRDNLPPEIITLICGEGESTPGLIYQHFALLRETIGCLELTARRAKSRGYTRREVSKGVIK